jgi:hypothetical protein
VPDGIAEALITNCPPVFEDVPQPAQNKQKISASGAKAIRFMNLSPGFEW